MPEPIRFVYRKETRADRRRTWRALSDTDAFNVAAKAGFEYPAERDAAGLAVKSGFVKKLGLTIRFREEAFSFRAPAWFRIRRVFESGPAAELVATATLTEHAGGTVIDYTLEILPRSSIFRPILVLDLRRTTEKLVGATLDAVVRSLDELPDDDEPPPSLAGPAPRLQKAAAERLETLLGELTPSPIRTRLGAFLRGAPEREQLMMSPITLAESWAAPLDEVVACFVEAARRGLLAVRLDLLCPACLVPRMPANLDATGPRVHCEGCGILLDQSFPEALAVHFTPNPSVRTIQAKIHCLGSPARTPHVVAQETLAPGAETDLATELQPGMYQLRTIPAFGPAALVEVSDSEIQKDAAFVLRGAIQPQLAPLRPLPRSVTFKNEQSAEVVALLERIVPPRRVLSLGRVLVEFPDLGDLVPNGGFFSRMTCFSGAALAVRAPSAENASALAAALSRARTTYASDAIVLAIYATTGAAIDDLSAVDRASSLWALTDGPVFEHVLGKRTVPMGPAVDRAYALLAASVPGRVAIPIAALESGEIEAVVRARALGAVPAIVSEPPEPAAWLVF
jgi:hypothetical protein